LHYYQDGIKGREKNENFKFGSIVKESESDREKGERERMSGVRKAESKRRIKA
jgi:hypothetical protein